MNTTRSAWTLGVAVTMVATPLWAQTFGEDLAFLKEHTSVVVLSDAKTGARVAVCPDLQGRVMTSSARGDDGPSFGWVNRELLASPKRDLHFNPYGGEDRFWLGPEGGQFALFFKKGDPFDLAHWYTPPAVDTEAYPVLTQAIDRVSFRKNMTLSNSAGTRLTLRLDRAVRLVPAAEAWKDLGLAEAPGVAVVAYESENKITNDGTAPWRKETGLVSVWILGMFRPTPATSVVIPFRPGTEAALGPVVNDAYFGKVPADRLIVRDHALFFRGDGQYRSKIGIPPARALPVLGSYDARDRVLTLVQFTRPEGATDYVNSMWEIQAKPYAGDVVNSYNDGPPAPGVKPLGPFYELETSSPAAALAPDASLVHRHRTLHLVGDSSALDAVARKVLGAGLDEIQGAFASAAASGEAAAPPRAISDPFRLLEPRSFSARRSSSNNPDPASNDDSKRPIPGETTVLADLEGPGAVSHIWITVADSEFGWPRLLRLRVYYDGSSIPSVDAPLGDFFAVGHGFERPVQSFMIRDSSDGRSRNSYWPMPFRKSCRITVTNEGRRRVANLYYQVDWQKLSSLPADTPYFHAHYRQALPNSGGTPYEVLNVAGRGHFVGTVLSVVQAEAGWFGEGDDHFFVDGETKASLEGTGTEDYFNDAWSLHVSDGLYTGVPIAEGTGLGARMTAYRWHLPDPIPFTKSLRFEIEHKGWTFKEDGSVKSAFGERTDLLSSVAFWYQQGIAQGLPEAPYGAGRLPQGNATQIEVDKALAEARAEKGKVSVSPELFWSKDVLLFESEGPSGRLEVPFDVPEDGDYELYAELARGSDYGVYTTLLDGKRPESIALEHEPGADVQPQTQFDGYAAETYVGAPLQVGWPHLAKGRHTLTFVCLGKREASTGYVLGVDDIVLARTGRAAWAAAATVRAPEVPSASVADLTRALAAPDPVVRGLAALGLRDQGQKALPALGALTAALHDSDANVRLMAGNALAALGPDAAPAVGALTATCATKGEEVHVLRSCAAALGAIGKPAASALPVLRELVRLPRVQWAAEAAIREIEARPR